MKSSKSVRRCAALLLLAAAQLGTLAHAQIKGANWVRVDHNYGSVPSTDPRRVGWNLEIATDAGTMSGWSANYYTLHQNYQIKTLMRIGYTAKPSAAERSALAAGTFACSSINALMGSLDAEAAAVPGHTLPAVKGFILGNEANLAEEWSVDGRGYGRVYQCYMARWDANATLAAKPLLAAGPGGCHIHDCPTFYSTMFDAMGPVVDGFAIHAYGQTAAAVGAEIRSQAGRINASLNAAARNKPIHVTEFNAGASEGNPLPVPPSASYFNGVMTEVRDYNAANANQVKSLLYFVDSASPWDRWGNNCHPAVAPQSGGWWQTSLCYNDAWRQAWLNSQPSVTLPPRNATIALSGIPAFMMPGQIKRFTATVTNTGAETWTGYAASNWYRLGATGINGFTFSAFVDCGGYSIHALDARIYTCKDVPTNTTNAYRVDARAPVSASNATFNVRMVRDGIEWFGQSRQQAVALGQAYCGQAVSQCILNARPDILPFYQGNGWNTSCSNRDAIVADWCRIDPNGCNALKAGTCASFNNTCRCSGGTHLGGAAIDPNATFCGYKVCGTNNSQYSCGTGNSWVPLNKACN
jgi:hypothetical protein